MSDGSSAPLSLAAHGSSRLPAVEVDSYNLETRDADGFVGDHVNKAAFGDMLERWRKPLRQSGDDPLGKRPTEEYSRGELGEVLAKGDPEAAGVVQGAIEDFAQALAGIIRRFLKLKGWKDTERIVVGGGFRGSRIGELAIGRAEVILRADKIDIDLAPIHNDPDEAGLIGAVQLAPAWIFKGHDSILAVDIGGTNIRAGVIDLNLKRAPDLSKACVWKSELWRHADEEKLTRDEAIAHLVKMLNKLIARAEKEKLKIAPFIGIGCPGKIEEDGTIDRGAQNLPGHWEGPKFNLPARIAKDIPRIADQDTAVIMHNDAVVQGLSEVPFMRDAKRWGVLTIGTGLGNARFTNRQTKD